MQFSSYFIIILISGFLNGLLALQPVPAKAPQTFVTLNAQRGCRVHIAAWLSPSCTHCATYFMEDIPKIASMPGFCLDLHLIPYLYFLDKPVSILVNSQGPENLLRNADLFFRNQHKWLDLSADRTPIEKYTEERKEDLEKFLKDIEIHQPQKFQRIKSYLESTDPFLYVKMFALNFFTIEHLEKYLPKGDEELINDLSIALISNLPKKDNDIVKFSPFFTDIYNQLIPDEKLQNGILTISSAENLLKTSDPSWSIDSFPKNITHPHTRKFAERANIDIEIEPEDIQDADDEISDNEDEDPELSNRLKGILAGLEDTNEEHTSENQTNKH